MSRLKTIVGGLLASALLLVGCSSSGSSDAPSTSSESPKAEASAELTVFAAASLNKTFEEINKEVFERDNPGSTAKFSFEGSSTLVDQLKQGAPADVFASADQRNMKKATDADLVEEPKDFTDNKLVLIVPKGNPAKVTGLNDSLDNAKVVICAPEVPCGNLTKNITQQAGVTIKPASEEQKVTDVRGKIEQGEGDAGLVYQTDAMAAGDKVETIPFGEDVDSKINNKNIYPIAVVKDSKNKDLAQKFIDAVLSEDGQKIMAKYGFTTVDK